MKPDSKLAKKQMSLSVREGLLIVVVAALFLETTNVLQYIFARRVLRNEAALRAEGELEKAQIHIQSIVNQAEVAVHNSIWIAQWCLTHQDSLYRVPDRLVRENPIIEGSTLALVPSRGGLVAPYVFQEGKTGEIKHLSLATEEYDYPSKEWFTQPIERGEGYWSEPYLDVGGGDVVMTTYSVPVKDASGNICAVLTADISLDWLTDLMGNTSVYPNAFNLVVSRAGQIMVSPIQDFVMKKTADEVALSSGDSASFMQVNRALHSGESGEVSVKMNGKTNIVFYAPVTQTGWAMAVVLPEEEMYAGIHRVGIYVKIMQLLAIILLALILRSAAKSTAGFEILNAQKERMEGELHVGHEIQMSMIPKTFPPFPDRKDLDFAASIVPAKEVGGDLYDYYIRDGKLLFCIGDVSGKGVPAALVMAVTRSLFRAASAHEFSPQRIVTYMNDSMSETNENDMFVTFFCGTLDLVTGHLRYCNAGHNPPFILTNAIRTLEVDANIPLGVMSGFAFTEQEMDLYYDDALFLFTDGLTEAENAQAEQFGLERTEAVLRTRRPSRGHLEALKSAVDEFVGDAPQSDDLTMLFIHYLGTTDPEQSERHLLLHNDIQQIPQLADFVGTIAHDMKLSQSLAMGLNLALEEAVTNVILYAYPKGSDGLVDIEAILRQNSLEFIISDSGIPFDPTAAPEADVTLSAEERPIGGLGIFLVRQIMDEVHYEHKDNKNFLSMIKNI